MPLKSIPAVLLLMATLSLCNLADKLKPAANSNAPDNKNAAAQNSDADRAAATEELLKIEYEMTTASLKGDIAGLAPYIADNYAGTSYDGSIQNKNQLLAATKPDKTTKSWKITDAKLVSLSDDSAVLTYTQTQTARSGQTVRARITDTFVKQNGRWLISAEQQTILK
jgi:hypothetical protein